MTPSQPIVIDGKVYDLYSMNLAVTSFYKGDGTEDANIAMRLIPTRVSDGQVETTEFEIKDIALGTLEGDDTITQTAVATIKQALQTYINEKGL
jgi:hypothetical protein